MHPTFFPQVFIFLDLCYRLNLADCMLSISYNYNKFLNFFFFLLINGNSTCAVYSLGTRLSRWKLGQVCNVTGAQYKCGCWGGGGGGSGSTVQMWVLGWRAHKKCNLQ